MIHRRLVLAALAGIPALLFAAPASAHGRSVSYSSWSFDATGARVRARISRLEFTRLALDPAASRGDSDRAGRLLARSLQLSSGGRPCVLSNAPVSLPAAEGWVVFGWRLECPAPGGRSLRSDLLLDVAPSHLHFARIVDGGRIVERVLSEAEPIWEIPDSEVPDPTALDRATQGASAKVAGTAFASYVALGVAHILSGWDHLAFVMALLLLASTVREVAALVTGFTVAHSVTLGLAVLGLVRPEGRVVEALIGFSVALVAAENAWILAGRDRIVPSIVVGWLALLLALGIGIVPRMAFAGLALFALCHFALLRASRRPARLRVAVAFAFGLIHGFGFAGVLAEMSLPVDRLAPALFGFNVGVELGQLAVVAVAWPFLATLARIFGGRAERLVAEVGSAAICGLGLFWFVTRSFA